MTTEIAEFMRKLERKWDDHQEALFTRRDVDAAMADMTAATSLRHFPTMTGADGRPELEHFYRDVMLPHLPGDLRFTRRSRTVDRFHLVDELTVSFRHVSGDLADPGDRAHWATRVGDRHRRRGFRPWRHRLPAHAVGRHVAGRTTGHVRRPAATTATRMTGPGLGRGRARARDPPATAGVGRMGPTPVVARAKR